MRLSEVLLRIGSSFVAWMIIYAYFIWLAVIERAGCGENGDEIFKLLLGTAPFAAGAAFLLRSTRPFPDIHNIIKWFSVPAAALLLLAIPVVWRIFGTVNLGDAGICADLPSAAWHRYWAPLQMVAIAICIWKIFTVWRKATIEQNESVGN